MAVIKFSVSTRNPEGFPTGNTETVLIDTADWRKNTSPFAQEVSRLLLSNQELYVCGKTGVIAFPAFTCEWRVISVTGQLFYPDTFYTSQKDPTVIIHVLACYSGTNSYSYTFTTNIGPMHFQVPQDDVLAFLYEGTPIPLPKD